MSQENPTQQFISDEDAAKFLDLMRQAQELAKPHWRQAEGARRMSAKNEVLVRKSPEFARAHPEFTSGLVTADDLAMGVKNIDLASQMRQAAERVHLLAAGTELAVCDEAKQNSLLFYRNVKVGAAVGAPEAKHIQEDMGRAFKRASAKEAAPEPTPAPVPVPATPAPSVA